MVDRNPAVSVSNFLRQVAQVNYNQGRLNDYSSVVGTRIAKVAEDRDKTKSNQYPTRNPDPRVDPYNQSRQLGAAREQVGATFGNLLKDLQGRLNQAIAAAPDQANELRSIAQSIQLELSRELARDGLFGASRHYTSTVGLQPPSAGTKIKPHVTAQDYGDVNKLDSTTSQNLRELYDKLIGQLTPSTGKKAADPTTTVYNTGKYYFFNNPLIDVDISPATQYEGNSGFTSYVVTLNRSGNLTVASSVQYKFSAASAGLDNFDFKGFALPANGTANFAAGQKQVVFTVYARGDVTAEADEIFQIDLYNPVKATITGATAQGTILTDDVAANFKIYAPTVTSGYEGNTADSTAVFKVTRDVAKITQTINLAIDPTSVANAADIVSLPGTLTFAAGITDVYVTVTIKGDQTYEPDEALILQLNTPPSASSIDPGFTKATYTILSDEPRIEIDAASLVVTQTEGNYDTKLGAFSSQVTPYVFQLNRVFGAIPDNNLTSTVDIKIAAITSSPVNGTDFKGGVLPGTTTVTFTGTQTTAFYTVYVQNDNTRENNEQFSVTLSNATGANLTVNTTATATVNDNDSDTIQISRTNAHSNVVAEGGAGTKVALEYSITRANVPAGGATTTVDYSIAGVTNAYGPVTAANAADFDAATPLSGTITFTGTTTTILFTVYAAGDAVTEGDEGFKVSLSNAVGGTFGAQTSEVGRIQEDDPGPVDGIYTVDDTIAPVFQPFTPARIAGNEGNGGKGQIVFYVNRILDTTQTVKVDLTYTGTANTTQNPDKLDFATDGFTAPSQITFNPGDTVIAVTAYTNGDLIPERNEGFQVTIALNDPLQGAVTRNTLYGVFKNDDGVPDVWINSITPAQNEGDTAGGFTPYVVEVQRNSGGLDTSQLKTGITWTITTGGTVTAADFKLVNSSTLPDIGFSPGVDKIYFTVYAAQDTFFEADETFKVNIAIDTRNGDNNFRGDGTAYGTIKAGGGSITSTILNDDSQPQVDFTTLNVTKAEGNTGTTDFVYTLTRSGGDLFLATSAKIGLDAGSVANASDFSTAFPATVNFAAGSATAQFTLRVTGDSSFEADETFKLTILSVTNGLLGTQLDATGTIQDDDTPTFNVSPVSVTNNEGNGAPVDFVVKVVRSGDTSGVDTVDIDFTPSGGTPATAADFGGALPTTKSLTFAAGQAFQLVTVQVTGDLLNTGDRTFDATLSNAAGPAVIGATPSLTATIQEDDEPTIAISAAPVNITEGVGANPQVFTITRSGGDLTSVSTVDFDVVASGANPITSADFTGNVLPGTQSVTFTAGQTVATVTIGFEGNLVQETDRTFNLQLSNVSAAVLGNASAIGTVLDDDVTLLDFNAAAVSSSEGNGSTDFVFQIDRSGDTTFASTVDVKFSNISSKAADFGGAFPGTQTVNFAAGQAVAFVTITVTGDTVDTGDRQFKVELTNASAATNINVVTATTATIVEDDKSTFDVAAVTTTNTEGNGGAVDFVVKINRTGDTTNAQTVDLAINPGTATAADFGGAFPATQTVNFAAGVTSVLVTVQTTGDTVYSGDRNFSFDITNPTGGSQLGATTTQAATIQDDDKATFTVAAVQTTNAEGNGGAVDFVVAINRAGDTSVAQDVDLSVTPGTATAADFGGAFPATQTISFGAGVATVLVTVQTVGDAVFTGDRTFNLDISNPTGTAQLGGTTTQAATIQDDDKATFTLAAVTTTNAEGNGAAVDFVFQINRAGDNTTAQTVDLQVNQGTAFLADFGGALPAVAQVTFGAGVTSLLYTVSTIGDGTFDFDRNFSLDLINPDPTAQLGGTITQTGTILEDD